MTDTPAPGSAYELLTRPTLELTDAEVEAIVVDLQARRQNYVDSKGKVKDDPRPKKPRAASKTAEEKAALTASILSELDIDL